MKHRDAWIIDPDEIRPLLPSANTQVGLLGFRTVGLLPEVCTEAADRIEEIQSHRHISGPDVPDRGTRLRKPSVAAANYPSKLGGEPPGRLLHPQWFDKPAHTDGSFIEHRGLDLSYPIGGCYRVVVDERHDLPGGHGGTAVSGTSCAGMVTVLHNDHVWKVADKVDASRGFRSTATMIS